MAAGGDTSKGGYDYEFVTPPPKSLECPVCLLTLRDPHVISCCGNEFCQACIERVQRDGKPCPLCNEPKFTTLLHKKLVRKVNALVIRCPQNELGCEWEGELGQLQSHLNPGAGVSSSWGCGFVTLECAYQCGAHLQRRLLQKHERDVCPKRPIEMQVASLMQKFETITTENQQLRQELIQVKQELKEKNDHLQKIYAELKEELRADIVKKCLSLQTHTMPLPVPPFYFTLSNMNQYLTVSAECECVYCSEPFYSHPGGYKMSVDVYPQGFGRCRGTHMSVYVHILRGEFDDQLHWPFDGSITIQAYNRTTEQWSNERTIVLNEEQCGLEDFKRPVDVLSHASWGFSDFLSISELNRDYMKKTNMVRF